MKKIFPFLFLLISLFSPFLSFAATPTIKLELFSENHNSQTDKFSWSIVATTTDIPNDGILKFYLYGPDNKQIGQPKSEKVKNNVANYLTGSILDPLTNYKVTALYSPTTTTKVFTKQTPAGNANNNNITPGGNGGTAIGGGTENQGGTTQDDPVNLTGQEESGNKTPNDVYKMLAPIGNLKCFGNQEGCIKDNIGEYFNVIFKLAIGLCAALAVVMIVIGGVQYMGDESVFGKTQAKERIYSAILGLIIALGSYALLNTINPDLLGGGGVKVNAVSAEIEEETTPLTANDTFTPGQRSEKCQSGIVYASTTNGNIPVCSTIKTNVENLISDAKKAGFNIFGYGYRSTKRQEQLRAQNCGGASNIYNINAACKPLTAYPGKSMHENGLAIDFTCDGATIKSRSNKCFIWLKNNASTPKYGLKNLQKEPWHWSTTGN